MVGSRKRSGEFPLWRWTPPLGSPAASTRQGSAAPERSGLKPSTIPPPAPTPGGGVAPPSSGTSSVFPPPYPPSSHPRSTLRVDFGLMTPAARVVDELLRIEPGERVAIVHDDANAEVAVAFEHASAERGAIVDRLPWGSIGLRPLVSCPPDIAAAVRTSSATVLAVTMEDGEYDARYQLITEAGAAKTRHVHMIGTGRKAFVASMMASTAPVFELLQALRAAMRPTSRISVRSAAGTHLEIEMAPHLRWFANGNVVRPGQWINVPFGALISSPATVTGTYVVDAAVSGGSAGKGGLLDGRPIRLTLEAGRVRRVECSDIALKRHVECFIAEGKNRERVGLMSLGANIGILSPLGEIVHDENMPGLHLALGESLPQRTGALWTAHGQLSFASAGADVDLDDEPLIRRGRYVRFV